MRRRYRKNRKKNITLFSFLSFLVVYYTYFFFSLEKALIIAVVIMFCIFIYERTRKIRSRNKYLKSGMKDVDTMSGTEFESFLLAHFEKLGYKGHTTQASNDFGADLVLKKDGDVIVIQAKRHNSKIGIKAVQEVAGAIVFYNASKGFVISNNYFTPAAIKLADAAKIELWDRKKLSVLIKSYKRENQLKEVHKGSCKAMWMESHLFCPRCNSELVERHGLYGEFYGCSNFPECSFTKNK